MEDIYVRHAGMKDDPHRHDYFTVVIALKANGEHIIDFESYTLEGGQVYFINPGQVHQIIEHEQSIGYAITFSYDFLAHNNISLQFIENLNLFQHFGEAPPLIPAEKELASIKEWCEKLVVVNSSEQTFKYESLGALLKLILIECNNLCTIAPDSESMTTGSSLLQQYKSLLNAHYQEWHGVSDYAGALHVSADHLNRVIKQLTGKKAKEHIQNRITLAAKRLIYFSDLSTKELAFELGFSEPANFSAFFKKCTGMSPSEFKKKAHVGNS